MTQPHTPSPHTWHSPPPEQAQLIGLPKRIHASELKGKRVLTMGSGHGSNFEALVPFLRAWGVEIAGLFCNRPRAHILQRAQRLQVPTHTLERPTNRDPKRLQQAVEEFLYQPFDRLLLAGYMRILPPAIVQKHTGKILNIHPSKLPDYPGLHAIERAYKASEPTVGVTVHIVTEAVDAGPILTQALFHPPTQESLELRKQRYHRVEHWLYPRTVLASLANSLP